MVYGSTDERAVHLRSFQKGLLRISLVNNVEFLPFDTQNKSDECSIPEDRHLQCFVGGDVRVNEQTGLTVMHNLWLREHNRIAKVLCTLNPHWNDEIIYQEARRIVAAQVQHITLNEWTPLIIGRRAMKEFNLFLKPSGHSHDYDPALNPSILNAFATAAYRFHTLIQVSAFFLPLRKAGRLTQTERKEKGKRSASLENSTACKTDVPNYITHLLLLRNNLLTIWNFRACCI